MTKLFLVKFLIVSLFYLASDGFAYSQTQTQTLGDQPDPYSVPQSTRDLPPGYPYNTGVIGSPQTGTATVPLRDFLSSRQDQLRVELVARIENLQQQLQQVMDERDRQYAQRFAAQQQAMEAALVAAQDAVEAALKSAETATNKAEQAANDRFQSVNEFRATLSDQANQFLNRSTADARFESLDEKYDAMYLRINTMQAQREGGMETWGWVFGFVGIALAIMAFLYSMSTARKSERIVVRDHGDADGST